MKTDNFCKENRPEAKKKLRLPDQLELVMEDGTVYRVRSFFVAEQQMGDVLDALSLEKVNRENWIPAHCPVESIAVLWYNPCRFLIVSRTAFREVKQENAGKLYRWYLRTAEPGR